MGGVFRCLQGDCKKEAGDKIARVRLLKGRVSHSGFKRITAYTPEYPLAFKDGVLTYTISYCLSAFPRSRRQLLCRSSDLSYGTYAFPSYFRYSPVTWSLRTNHVVGHQ